MSALEKLADIKAVSQGGYPQVPLFDYALLEDIGLFLSIHFYKSEFYSVVFLFRLSDAAYQLDIPTL